jgi:hypothetical protein
MSLLGAGSNTSSISVRNRYHAGNFTLLSLVALQMTAYVADTISVELIIMLLLVWMDERQTETAVERLGFRLHFPTQFE